MSYSMNLGNWNSVFAVPSDVVDKHIKLAGSAQLKVLLWVLRHAGEDFSVEDISTALSMHKADVKDSMQYWIENDLIRICDNEIVPGQQKEDVKESKVKDTAKEDVSGDEKSPKRAVSKPQKVDNDYIDKRVSESEEMKFLIQEAEIILSRPISSSDISSLITFHDFDGLPVDVIIMLLQYAASIGKDNMRYIDAVARSWGSEGIDSVEKVEQKIKILTEKRKAWGTVQKIVGIEPRLPSAKEEEIVNRWINQWHVKEELIKEAYERCVNAKGRYIPSYMDSIIKNWNENNITTIGQAVQKRSSGAKPNKNYSSYEPTYNIEEYEKEDIFQ